MQGPFQSKPVLLVDSTRKCVLDLFIHRIFGREDKSFCSQGNIRAAITANSLWSILVGRGPFCVVLFRKSKQKLSAIHFRMRMMKSPATSTEQIRMRTSILHIRMEEIHAGNGGIKLSAMKKKKKNRWRKLQSAKENSVFCSLSEDKFPQCQTLLVLVLLQLLKRKIFQLIKMLVYIYRTNIVAYVNTNIHPQVTTGQVKKE